MRIVIFVLAVFAILEGLVLLDPFQTFPTVQLAEDGGSSLTPDDLRGRLASSPFQSNLWLRLSERRAGDARNRALYMAYLVGGEKIEDIPSRLTQAVVSGAFRTDALRDFVRSDIVLVIRRKPALKSLLMDLDEKVQPENRDAYDTMLRDADPDIFTSKPK